MESDTDRRIRVDCCDSLKFRAIFSSEADLLSKILVLVANVTVGVETD